MQLPKQLYNSIPPTTYSKSIPSGVTAEAVFDIVKLNLRPYIRIAGLTGCLALVAAAYGSHGKLPLNLPSKTTFEKDAVFIADRDSASFKEIFERANKQQFFTAFALTGVAFTKFPALVSVFVVVVVKNLLVNFFFKFLRLLRYS